LVIKDNDMPIADKYSLISWLATLIKLNSNNTITTLISMKANKFINEKLEKIIRLLYIQKVILWPFGRS
jgi:hypothetical protein